MKKRVIFIMIWIWVWGQILWGKQPRSDPIVDFNEQVQSINRDIAVINSPHTGLDLKTIQALDDANDRLARMKEDVQNIRKELVDPNYAARR